jgi:hypothetical protein
MHIRETLADDRLQNARRTVNEEESNIIAGKGPGGEGKKEVETYTSWYKLARYHGAFARDDTWVGNRAREHAEAFLCDRGLHVVHRGKRIYLECR